jgi:archaellum biogenesis ATPase FlaH
MVNALTFGTFTDRLPPHNVDAEQAVLGAILLDPQAILKVKDTLPVEAFYLEIHQDIYRAAINLCKKDTPVHLLTVTNYLEERGLLRRVGGKTQLAHLLESCVTSVTIESTAKLLLSDYVKRKVAHLGNELLERGHDIHIEIADLLRLVQEKTSSVVREDYGLSGGDKDEKEYTNLIDTIKKIERTISSPGLKLFKLQKLASACKKRLADLEHLYIKSLCESVSGPLRNLESLNMDCKSETREWLVHGIIPAHTTFLIHALGGVGKTKLLYDLAYCLIEGKDWNEFSITAKSRKVLIYQEDESPHDMRQALLRRGFYEPGFNSENFRYRRGWTMDNIPQLVRDIEEFQPDLIIIDSITTANRNSIFSENETAYARPLLEINQIAAEKGVTIGLIHHSNGEGGSRGTKAIFNSVSEVLCLKRNQAPEANEQDKVLEIQKSRARRFPCSYNLFFNEEDFSLSCLGEVNQKDTSDEPTKARILSFLQNHRGVRYEAEEISHYTETPTPSARRCLNRLASDGLISVLEIRTDRCRKNLYFIDFQDSTHQSTCGSNPIEPDHSDSNLYTESDSSDSTQNSKKNQKGGNEEFLNQESDQVNEDNKVLHSNDSSDDQPGVIRVRSGSITNDNLGSNQPNEESNPTPPSSDTPKKEYKPICIKLASPQGDIQVNAIPSDATSWTLKIRFPDDTQVEEFADGIKKEIKQRLQEIVNVWNQQFSYTVQTTLMSETTSIKGCKLVKMTVSPSNPKKGSYLFQTPSNKAICVYSTDDFKLEE